MDGKTTLHMIDAACIISLSVYQSVWKNLSVRKSFCQATSEMVARNTCKSQNIPVCGEISAVYSLQVFLLFGRSVGQSVSRSVGQSVSRSVGQSASGSVGQFVGRSVS